MNRSLLWLFTVFTLVGLLGSFQVLAQPSEEYAPRGSVQTQIDKGDAVMAEYTATSMAEQKAQVADNAAQAVQMDENAAAITEMQRMTGTQDFILKLVAIIMPLLIAMMTGAMLWIQLKQKAVSEIRSVAAREDLILVARSVNGVKTELVATAELAAFLEGVQTEANGVLSRNAAIRLAELQEAKRYATEKAEALAHAAIVELTEKQAGRVSTARVVPVAVGEQKVVEGVEFGEQPENPEAIPVATGEVKNVVGKTA